MFQDIYRLVKKIPRGKVTTYGNLAKAIGLKDVRKIGYALHSNKYNSEKDEVPCHRVVKSDGSLAQGFAFGGKGVQRKILESEGVVFEGDGKIDLTKYGIM